MKLPEPLRYLCFTLALASGAGWAASATAAEETAPATQGLGSPPGADMPNSPGKVAPKADDPASTNGALDMRHVEKKPANTTPHKKHLHKKHGTSTTKDSTPAPAQ